MHCGWMDEGEWIYPIRLPAKQIGTKFTPDGMQVPHPAGVEWTEDVCPGWAVRQPLIEEIAQACVAFEKGSLASMFPDIAQCVAEGVFEMWQARQVFDQAQVQELTKDQANG